jgi:hypothetical protein
MPITLSGKESTSTDSEFHPPNQLFMLGLRKLQTAVSIWKLLLVDRGLPTSPRYIELNQTDTAHVFVYYFLLTLEYPP